MANFTPSQKTAEDFNNNVQYVNNVDAVQAQTVNNLIESQLWTQGLATNQPDTTYIADVGTPTAEIELLPDGTPRFKFANLRGLQGNDGNNGIGVVASGWFYLSVDEVSGELYAEYNSDTAPEFEIEDNGDLWYIIPEN